MQTLHVALTGQDHHNGTAAMPLRTIQAAANLAQPGDTVTVHGGVYRERVDPPRGGVSNAQRITFEAAPGEEVVITGSERIQSWVHDGGDVWVVTLPNSFFGAFNPYADKIRGHWFLDRNRDHHTGAVYLEGHWLAEAMCASDVYGPTGAQPLWFGEVAAETTTIYAQFPDVDPNSANVEINVRQSVFYPSKNGINYLTVRGFKLRHAATNWAPPTTEQIGLIGTNWGKGWIIEKNDVSYSVCSGITLGKYHDPEDFGEKPIVEFTQAEDTYHGTIRRALARGWTGEITGHHIVRNNHVSHCEMAGICGSLGPIFCEVTGNVIHDIHVRRAFAGWEMAGIKFHGAIDTRIAGNHVYRCGRGLWLDWMSQGTRVTGNLFHDNGPDPDLFLEVNHGPCVIDHNLFLSRRSFQNWSEGTVLAHNIFAGEISHSSVLNRTTPHHRAHSTEVVAFLNIPGGDDRVFNNIFLPRADLTSYDAEGMRPSFLCGNVFIGNAKPAASEPHAARVPAGALAPACSVTIEAGRPLLRHTLPTLPTLASHPIDDAALGRACVTGLPFQDCDGSALKLDSDYFGRPHNAKNPRPGPFAEPAFPDDVTPAATRCAH